MYNFPKFAETMANMGFDEREIRERDQELFDLQAGYYADKEEWEARETDKTLEQIEREHYADFQEFWEDTFGEDTWDDRHEIYALEE